MNRPGPSEGPARILVVDDHALAREAAARIMTQAGFEVREAEDGPKALALMSEWPPDLVLSDLMMPGMTGLELTREIRAHWKMTDVVVVLLSSLRTSPEDQAAGFEAEADGYISRPVDPQELVARVRAHLRTQALARQLAASEARFRDLLARQPDGVVLVDGSGCIRYSNPAAESLLSRSYADLVGQPFGYPLADGDETELDITDAEGAIRVANMRVAEIEWEGAPAWLATLRDETRRHAAEARVREQAKLLSQVKDAIIALDAEGRITYWNPGASDLYRWDEREAMGRRIGELTFPDPPRADALLRQVLEEGEWAGEVEQTLKTGEPCIIEGRWTATLASHGEPYRVLCVHTDVTEQKTLMAQFLRAQRMESIGTLAGGIAHDLNNVLAPILMSIELLQMDEEDQESREILSTIYESARRGADLVKQVLIFSRGVEGARKTVDLPRVMRDVGLVVRDTFPKNINLETELSPDLWTVVGDVTQVYQVLMNLAVNARDAMPEGGTLRMEASNETLDSHYVAMVGEATPGPHVRMAVTDSGVGMEPEVRDRALEPFFTTKEVGKGTGLGLSTVAAIVKSHGGLVNLYSEPGQGTTVRLYFPAQTESSPALPAIPELEVFTGQDELIMVVDDESSIRQISQQTLEAFGYRAMTAGDGTEALAIYGSHGAEISAVVIDVMMPIMDGPATIRALRRINPQVKVIASSGLISPGVIAGMQGLENIPFLAKPYTASQLLAALKELLERV